MFLERLNSLTGRIDGAVAISLVAEDGIPVESVSALPGLDLEAVAAELVTLARAIAVEQRELSVGGLRQFTISGERLSFVLSRVASHFWILAALSPDASLGRARFELKRAELLFEDELD
jgi:predicted regulator of Ras-like GTPase activity (Roadblock/LC7/MglB family)